MRVGWRGGRKEEVRNKEQKKISQEQKKLPNLKEKKPLREKPTIQNSRNRKTNELDGTKKMYKEIMEAVKVSSPANLAYGRERMAAWLLDSRIQ